MWTILWKQKVYDNLTELGKKTENECSNFNKKDEIEVKIPTRYLMDYMHIWKK